MKIKHMGFDKTSLNQFDILGKDEVALSKAFAYVLSKNSKALYTFLHSINIHINNTPKNYRHTEIDIEKHRKEGRTDIEIYHEGKYHVIIECKVRGNKVKKQRRQYLKSFSSDDNIKKVMVFISQNNDSMIQTLPDIETHNLNWMNIVELYKTKEFKNAKIVQDFVKFAEKRYKMREQKEILIQDLSKEVEIRRFKEFNVYRRSEVYGTPLYFAPYFTRSAQQAEGEGISYLSKILGIITLNPAEGYDEDDLKEYANKDKELLNKWKQGLALEIKKQKNEHYTFFFLADPVKLPKPLLKDGSNKKGRGKDWIAAMIPPNRCITFEEFVKRVNN